MVSLPDARVAVVGGGIAGVATAAALARAGRGPGVILEREPIPGAHASGRNAGIACLTEFDPVVRRLAAASVPAIRRMRSAGHALLQPTGGLHLGDAAAHTSFDACVRSLLQLGINAELLDASAARRRFPFLADLAFDVAIYCSDEGVIDIHALLLAYLEEARRGGFVLLSRTDVLDLLVEDQRVAGVVSSRGLIRAEAVVDAGGAWAGRLGQSRRLPLQPVRRHLFVSASNGGYAAGRPLVWHVSDGFYFRPEGEGLLLSPCDESFHEPGSPVVDPGAVGLLATKLAASAPHLADLPIRSSWACLRTFAADRRPVIGADPTLPGLYHVSGLGGFGMGTSWGIGEVAAAIIQGIEVPFVDAADVSPARLATLPGPLHLTGASMTNA